MQALGGLISGIDTGSLIQAMLQQQAIPLQQLQQQKDAADIKISRFGEFMSKLSALESTMDDSFSRLGDVLALNASSGDEAIATVSATGEATAGNYDITVNTLAEFEKDRSQAFANPAAEVTAGTLSIGHGSSPDWVDITIEEGDTLADVVDKINASDASVSASIISDGTDSYLQITALDSGFDPDGLADDAIRVQESYTGATGQALSLTQINTAKNAEVEIDGLTVTSRSNSVATALPGVTLDLHDTGSTTFDVSKDKEGTIENLQAFVDAFNAVAQLIDEELDIDGEQNRDRSLSGEASIRSLQGAMAEAMSLSIEGLEGTFSALSEVGISRDSNGKLEIDRDALDDALDTDMVGVANLFLAEGGLADRIAGLQDTYAEGDDSVLGARKDALGDSQDRIDTRIERLEVRIDKQQARLERQFMQMELAMAQMQQQGGALASLMFGGTEG